MVLTYFGKKDGVHGFTFDVGSAFGAGTDRSAFVGALKAVWNAVASWSERTWYGRAWIYRQRTYSDRPYRFLWK